MHTFCCVKYSAPMPFVVGLREAHLPELLELPLDQVVVVFLEKNQVVLSHGGASRSQDGFKFPLPEVHLH
jgi:hypothetical protein